MNNNPTGKNQYSGGGMRLFHGTSSKVGRIVLPRSVLGGQKKTFLTTSPKEARAWAERAAKDRGGKAVVFAARAAMQKGLTFDMSTLRGGDYYTIPGGLRAAKKLRLK